MINYGNPDARCVKITSGNTNTSLLSAKYNAAIARAERAEAALAHAEEYAGAETNNLVDRYIALADVARRLLERAKAAEALAADRASEADACHDIMAECRKIAGHPHTGTIDAVRNLLTRAEAAEAELAAVPIAELRRIVEMDNARQWSSVEGPPLWEKVESWLKKQR